MKKSQYGEMQCCRYCQQDIQFMGGSNNWRDRGSNRKCCAYVDQKTREIVLPKTKHAPKK